MKAKTYKDFVNTSDINEGKKIEFVPGKKYQSGNAWTLYQMDDKAMFSINVNKGAGWDLDIHDPKNETIKLMDMGKQKATLRFKDGNIQKFADQMYKLNDKTTWGETEGLTAEDYADILRAWIDMGIDIDESK